MRAANVGNNAWFSMPETMMREGSGVLAPPAPPALSFCGFGQALFGCLGQSDAYAPPTADNA